jgi:hypothetical protein
MPEESKAASLDRPLAPEAPAEPKSTPAHKRRRWPLILNVIVAVTLIFVGIPRIIHALNTVSTDDAYVNSHVTFVAPRVFGQVARVLVDDNYRIKTGGFAYKFKGNGAKNEPALVLLALSVSCLVQSPERQRRQLFRQMRLRAPRRFRFQRCRRPNRTRASQ